MKIEQINLTYPHTCLNFLIGQFGTKLDAMSSTLPSEIIFLRHFVVSSLILTSSLITPLDKKNVLLKKGENGRIGFPFHCYLITLNGKKFM